LLANGRSTVVKVFAKKMVEYLLDKAEPKIEKMACSEHASSFPGRGSIQSIH